MVLQRRKLDDILESLSRPRGSWEIWSSCAKDPFLLPRLILRTDNIIVDNFRTQVAHAFGGSISGRYIRRFQFGTSSVAETAADTNITSPVNTSQVTHSYPTTKSVQFVGTLGATVGNGTAFYEVGAVFVNGTLAARKTFPVMTKSSPWVWTVYWTIVWP